MTQQIIDNGDTPGDPAAEGLYTAFDKVNENFTELYGAKTEFVATYAALPGTGQSGKVYIVLSTGGHFIWNGTVYVPVAIAPVMSGGALAGLYDPISGSQIVLASSPARTLFNLPAPVILAPSGTVGNNGALTLGTSLVHTFSSGCWMYFPAGAIYAGSAAGLWWVVMSSATAGVIYDNTNNGYINRPASVVPIVATGPGAFTGVTGTAIELCKFDVPAGLVNPGDVLRLAFVANHTNSANNKTYAIKAGSITFSSPVWTTNDGWSQEMRFHCTGPNQVSYPQGWVPTTDAAHGFGAVFVEPNRTLAITANRATATENVRLMGFSLTYQPAA